MVSRAAVAVVLLLLSAWAQAAITLTSADGHTLQLAAPTQHIVSLSPALTELVYDIGAGTQMAGAGTYSNYPAAAMKLPRIGDAFRVDTERLLALDPDMVLAWQGGTPTTVIERLRELHLNVLVIGAHELPDIARNLELLGHTTGHEKQAEIAAKSFLDGLKKLREQYADKKSVRVFYEISTQPLFTIGGKQIISRMIELCGGHNIFSDITAPAAAVSLETVLARDPQVIVTGGDPGAATRLKEWQRWPQLSAVKTSSLFSISGDLLARATPRILQGGQQLCGYLDVTQQKTLAMRR